MSRKLSIITAAYAPLAHFFDDTIESVLAQTMPEGWTLEWLVQEDGEIPSLENRLLKHSVIRYDANGAHTGIAATRNLALTRARGDVIHVLDHDDVLLPDAYSRLLPRLEERDVHWVVGQADDWLTDGGRRPYASALPFGRIEAGAVNSWAIEHEGNWPIHCAGLIMRTTLVRAVGGWGGVPVDDDIVMFSAMSELAAGYNDPSTTWLYRIHERQTHRSAQWRERSTDGRRIALQRIQALRASGLSIGIDVSALPAQDPVDVGPAAKDNAAGGVAWWQNR